MWFPFRKQVSSPLPYLQSCSRSWLRHNPSLSLSACVFYRFVAPQFVQHFPGCFGEFATFWSQHWLLLLLSYVFSGDGSEEWKWAEWKPIEDFMAGGSAWRHCITISPRPVHVGTGRSETPHWILATPPIAHKCTARILIATEMYVNWLKCVWHGSSFPLRMLFEGPRLWDPSSVPFIRFTWSHIFFLGVIFACEGLQSTLFIHGSVSRGLTTHYPINPPQCSEQG